MPWIIDQFGHKRCQKKRRETDYKIPYDFFQDYFFLHEQSAVKNSFSKYVRYDPDGLFWLNLYILNFKSLIEKVRDKIRVQIPEKVKFSVCFQQEIKL